MSELEVRTRLVEALETDLDGPFDPRPHAEPRSSHTPSRSYLCGRLQGELQSTVVDRAPLR